MTIVWLLEIESRYELRHGATLRYTHLSKGLMASGHRVYFVLNNHKTTDRRARCQYLARLREQGCFVDYLELDAPPYSRPWGKLSRLLIHPHLKDRCLRSSRIDYCHRFGQVIQKLQADVCILSDRNCLFLIPQLRNLTRTIIDWCDSSTIYYCREIRRLLKSFEIKPLPGAIKELVCTATDEACYSREADANMTVSPRDKRCLDFLNHRPDRNFVVPNGVAPPSRAVMMPVAKEPNTLIFTGSMGFPPNYHGAIWLIDHVLPLLISERPNLHLVIAGQEPITDLLKRAGPNVEVTGLVPDLSLRIARSQLYVAPLISGTGFRNKVVEALVNGTYVIGTPMALEFLDESLRAKLLSASTAEDFARKVLMYLNNPQAFDARLGECLEILRREYSWESSVNKLEALCEAREGEKTGRPKVFRASA